MAGKRFFIKMIVTCPYWMERRSLSLDMVARVMHMH